MCTSRAPTRAAARASWPGPTPLTAKASSGLVSAPSPPLTVAPPCIVLLVPVAGQLYPILEIHWGFPAHRPDPADVESVAVIVAGPVLHAMLEGPRPAASLQHGVCHLHSGDLRPPSHVVGRAWLALPQNSGDCVHVVVDI